MPRKAAFAYWEGRVAPVFDEASRVLLVEAARGSVLCRCLHELPGGWQAARAMWLAEHGVDTLVCGAISRWLLRVVASYGIEVVPFVAGDVDEVVEAWIDGRLAGGRFMMPGCRRGGGSAGLARRARRRGGGQGRGRGPGSMRR